jgi:GNAT superfamily N-acetyltransferase
MGRLLHAESPRYSRMQFSEKKVETMIRRMVSGTLTTPAPGGALVAEKDGMIVGMMGGFVTETWFSEDKIASDYTLYILPEYRRKGRIAVELVRAFERWAIAQGAVDIVPGTSTEIDAEATRSFYQKMGYEHYGHSMIKRVR